MRPISLPHRLFPAAATAAAVVTAAACGDPVSLPPATFENVVDTVVLAALTGTPISAPSAYDMVFGSTVRTDRTAAFDVAFDIDATGTARLYPAATLGLASDAGLLRRAEAFAAITSAPLEGYVSDTAIAATPGLVFVGRSRSSNAQCVFGTALPRYGKFHVLAVDLPARTVTLELLVDLNCGYRGLEPGTPED